MALAWDQLPEETRQRLALLTPEMLAVLRSVFGGLTLLVEMGVARP